MIALGSVLRQLLRGGEVGPSACGLTALAPFGSAVLSLLTLQTRNSFAGGWMCRRQKFAGSPLREMAKLPSRSVIRGYLHARTYRRPRARTRTLCTINCQPRSCGWPDSQANRNFCGGVFIGDFKIKQYSQQFGDLSPFYL